MKSSFLFPVKSVFKKSLIVLSGLLLSYVGNAQKITPVATVGFGLSDWTLSENSSLKTGMLPSLELGVLLDYHVNESLFIESGLLYSEVGAEVKIDELDSPSYSLGYISLPAYGKIRLSNGFSIYAGPKAALLISAKEDNFDDNKYDVKEAFKKADFSLAGGVSYTFAGGFEVGVQFTKGFLNVYNNGNTRVTNFSFGVNAAYNITMPKA